MMRSDASMLPVGKTLSSKMANMSFVCAVLVVFMHVGSPEPVGSFPWFFIEFFHEILGDMAVPYFFMASGFFLAGHMEEPGWYPREMKKRFRTLVVPYVLWSLLFAVYLMPVAILANLHAHRDWCWNLGFPGWIKTFGLDFLQNPLLPPFWFLRWLICLCLASPLLYWIIKKTGGWGLCAFYIVAVLKSTNIPWMHPASWWNPWKWVLYPFGTFYFLLGIVWRMGLFEDVPDWAKRIPVWVGLAFLVAKLASFAAAGFGWTTPDGAFGTFFVRNMSFLTPCLLALVWKCVPIGKWPVWLTGASFGLYVGHPFFTHFLDSIRWFWGLGIGPGGMCLLRWAFAMAGCLAGVAVLKNCFPRTARLLLGAR